MRPSHGSALEVVEGLRREVGARAAGVWWMAGDRLEQVAFAAAEDMPEEVAGAFAEATRTVSLGLTELGIVVAAIRAEVAVSRAAELPGETGSGAWLRRFGAERSVAVPLIAAGRVVRGVLSIALPEGAADDSYVADRLRRAAEEEGWLS